MATNGPDSFADLLPTYITAGWIITSYARYDPTRVEGITPSGKSFTFHLADNNAILTIAGNAITSYIAKEVWLTGQGALTALTDLRSLFSASQR